MPDLFINPDERFLLAKWDHLSAVLRIVTRDYRRVLTGDTVPDRHRTIIIQTVSDLLDLDADLVRLGKDSPSAVLTGWSRAVWHAAAAWVSELRTWRFPHESMPVADIEHSLVCRKLAEEEFNAVVCDRDSEGVAPTVLVQTA